MIILCGIPSETPMRMVAEQVRKLSVPYVFFNQRNFAEMEISFEIIGGQVKGWINLGDQTYNLEDIHGVYLRSVACESLPEMKDEPDDSPRTCYCKKLTEIFTQWTEITSAHVVNRISSMSSNSSKPYQSQLIREKGFEIPSTLITNDPASVLEFQNEFGKVIYKSISGIRSIVKILHSNDIKRLGQIRWCPVQFQEFVEGTNIRVHVVNDKVFATSIQTTVTDYRYAQRENAEAVLTPTTLSEDVSSKCIDLARSLDLPFAGIDLKVTPNNKIYCFEVNPSPAFSYFESETGQPIAHAVARYLCKK